MRGGQDDDSLSHTGMYITKENINETYIALIGTYDTDNIHQDTYIHNMYTYCCETVCRRVSVIYVLIRATHDLLILWR